MGAESFTTPGAYEWEVPPGVTEVTVTTWGANMPVRSGGRAVHPVTPGETLHVFVGGAAGMSAGFNGGGAGVGLAAGPPARGTHGSGASDVRQGGDTAADRVQVMGGAGGPGRVLISTDPTPASSLSDTPWGDGIVVASNTSPGGGVGAPAGASFPEGYGSAYTPSPFSGTSWPGAGGGGYVGGSSGTVEYRNDFSGRFHLPTRGQPGTNYTATAWVPWFSGFFPIYLWDRPDAGFLDGRVDLEWEIVRRWNVGHVGR